MDRMTIAEIEQAVGGVLCSGDRTGVVTGVSTDSRTAGTGDLFVPIIGAVHDAHQFIPMAAENGCRAFLVSRADVVPAQADCAVIRVADTTAALQALAAWYLARLHLKTVAVTGSVGKTSTRDMVACVLRTRYRTGAPIKNYNNDIGVPLTVFSFDHTLEAAVLEVGMDHSGEIHRLVDLIRPDVAVITNVGVSHIENLGSREAILAAKLEVTDFFGTGNTLVINQDNDLLGTVDLSGDYNVVRVGTTADCAYQICQIEDLGSAGSRCLLTVAGETYPLTLTVPGVHNLHNAALAIAACACLGVDPAEAVAGLARLTLTGKRLTVQPCGDYTVIDDTYNAAPDSMKSAIDTLVHTPGGRHVAILAGMNELGTDSAAYHREVGRHASAQAVSVLYTVGAKAADIAAGASETAKEMEITAFPDKATLLAVLRLRLRPGDVILVKGSRAMEMEEIVEALKKEQE